MSQQDKPALTYSVVRPSRLFQRIFIRRMVGFVVAGFVGIIVLFLMGNPLAVGLFVERIFEWAGASASDALIEAKELTNF